MVLEKIIQLKRIEVGRLKQKLPIQKIETLLKAAPQKARSLAAELSARRAIPNLICEMKKASPSEGVLRERFSPRRLAVQFESAGACGISVLTERHYFLGSPTFIRQVRAVTSKPVLRKDFIVDEYQIHESKLLGADAILLIVSILTDDELKRFLKVSRGLGLEALVEVHQLDELGRAMSAGATMVGINNRNLETLRVDLATAENMIRKIPKQILKIVESGIQTRSDLLRYESLGVNGFLIGTALMKSENAVEKINELTGHSHGQF